jgi:processive 1,2-diacylglycerol beta-glucosyltransferase
LRAAEAIGIALRRIAPEAHIHTADVLRLCTPIFRFCYAQTYLFLAQHAPHLLRAIYNRIDAPVQRGSSWWHRLRVWLERAQLKPFLAFLDSQPWDLVIATFFLPAEIIVSLREAGAFGAPLTLAITDFESHRNWAVLGCDRYFTATQEAARYLQYFGVPPSATSVTGIPIHPAFGEPQDRATALRRFGLGGDRPIVVLLGGGQGAGPMVAPYRALLDVAVPLDLVAVRGRNEPARQALQRIACPRRHRTTVLGYTEHMQELLAVADLAVTKPGGLTVSEALARGVGLVLIAPIPGQEERNSDFLLERGAAIKANHLRTLAHKVTQLLRQRLEHLKANAHLLGRPNAARAIADESLRLIRPAAGDNMAAKNELLAPLTPRR